MQRFIPWLIVVLLVAVQGWQSLTGGGAVDGVSAAEVVMDDDEKPKTWAAFQMEELLEKREAQKRSYLQFLKVPTLSTGIYFLPKDAVDGQSPHDQDEVYYVLSGRATLEVEGDHLPAKPGSVLFVKAHAKHRFHSIKDDLTVLVFFSTAEVKGES